MTETARVTDDDVIRVIERTRLERVVVGKVERRCKAQEGIIMCNRSINIVRENQLFRDNDRHFSSACMWKTRIAAKQLMCLCRLLCKIRQSVKKMAARTHGFRRIFWFRKIMFMTKTYMGKL